MYLSFFALREPPFNLTPDPRFLFLSPHHEEALTHLLYGIAERKGFIEITGEVGTGKTVLCRALLERLGPQVSTALIFNSYVTKTELLRSILQEFGLSTPDTPPPTDKDYIDVLNAYLLREFAAGRNAVVVIDEAQNLEPTVLEQLRMLSNLETERVKLLQIILVGQPELRDKLATVQMRQLEQRIAVRFHIHELSRTETAQYITHRMSVAGASHTVKLSSRALTLLHQQTGGIPRRINLLCDRVLMAAFVRGTHRLRPYLVRQSVRDLAGSWQAPPSRLAKRLALGGAVTAGALGLVGLGVAFPTWQDRLAALWPERLAAPVMVSPPPPPALSTPAPAPAPLPQAPPQVVSVPEPPGVPLAAVPVLEPPPPPLEVDVTLAQTLWQIKTQTEAAVTPPRLSALTTWEAPLLHTSSLSNLEVMPWQAGPWLVQHLTRPCLMEVLPEPATTRPVLWVLVRGLAEGVVVYQEAEGFSVVPWQRLRQIWYGRLYFIIEAGKYGGGPLRPGMQGEQVRVLQQLLKERGYLAVTPSGQYDVETAQAVKRFQRDTQLLVDGLAGRQTLIMLLHVGTDSPERAT